MPALPGLAILGARCLCCRVVPKLHNAGRRPLLNLQPQMPTPPLQIIKAELTALPQKELVLLRVQLARHSKSNKALLGYCLFGAHNISGFIGEVNALVAAQHSALPTSLYLAQKSLRKTSNS
jgi:hypothetical protein